MDHTIKQIDQDALDQNFYSLTLRREGGVWPKKIDFFCLDIFYYLSYVGSGTFYRNEKSSLVVE